MSFPISTEARARRSGEAASIKRIVPPTVAVGLLVVVLSVDLGPQRFVEWAPVRTIALLGLAMAGVAATVFRPTRWIERSVAELLLISAFGWVCLTAPLAADPLRASLTAAALFGTVLLTATIAHQWPPEQVLIAASFGLGLALAIAAALGSSTSSDGRWSGLLEEPNSLAVVAALAFVVGLATIEHHPIGLVAAALGTLTLVMTQAALPAAAAVTGALFVLLPLAPVSIRIPLVAGAFSVIVSLATAIAVISADALPGDGGYLKSLNGRTGIWSYLADFITERPIVGYGAASTDELIALGAFDERVHWGPTHAHNALLEIGVAGGLPAVGLLAATIVASLVEARRGRSLVKLALTVTFAGLALSEHLVREPTVALLVLALAVSLPLASHGAGSTRPG